MNKIQIIGRIGLMETQTINDKILCRVSIADTETYKQGSQKITRTHWHNCTAWGGIAEVISKYCEAGDNIYIEGVVRYQKVDEKIYTNITILSFEFLETKASKEARKKPSTVIEMTDRVQTKTKSGATSTGTDDIPF